MGIGVDALDKPGFSQTLGDRQGTGNNKGTKGFPWSGLYTMEVRLSVGGQTPSKSRASKTELSQVAVVHKVSHSGTWAHQLSREGHSLREHGALSLKSLWAPASL